MYTDENGKKWWKGNLHMHTRSSDGRLTVDEAAELYRANGYDFIAVTDHWKMSEEKIHENGLLMLSGCEYDVSPNVRDGIFHVTSVGCTSVPDIKRGDSPAQMIAEIHRHGGLANLAHPAWSMNTCEQLLPLFYGEVLPLHGADMTEIFNSVSDLPRNCRPYSGDVLDQLAARGYLSRLIATDDTHWYIGAGDGWKASIAPAMYGDAEWDGESDACRSYIMVQAEECTRECILAAIRNGDFYATQGPAASISFDGDKVHVKCSPAERVVFFTDSAWCDGRSKIGHGITSADFKVWHESFVRAEIYSNGKYAWTGYVDVRKNK